ncbi:MAG: chlorophyllase/cutinase-like alpha/beta fold protein [Polyangiaceae bacterium]
MVGSRIALSRVVPWLVGLGVVAVHVGCGSSSPSSRASQPSGDASTGNSYDDGGIVGGGSGSSGATGGSSSGTGAGTSSGGPTSSSSGGDAGTSGGTGTAEGGSGVALVNCMPASTSPCGSYSGPEEDGGTYTLQLGPYGAQLDVNVGTGFENTVTASSQPGSSDCASFASLFSEPSNLTAQLLQTTVNGVTVNYALYSAYQPANWPSTPVPVITWGNGTCAQPEGYGALLRYVASYGYFVIAANDVQVGTANSDGTQPMLKALDYAAAANMDSTSPFYQKLDMTKVGAMGHSQGGGATATASSDSRIKYVIDFNADDSGIAKPYLAVSGDMDITGFTVASMMSAIDAATEPAAYLYYHDPVGSSSDALKGHLVLMLTPQRVTSQTVAWWQMWFRSDAASTADFVGSSCGFCGQTSNATNPYDYGADSMLQSK